MMTCEDPSDSRHVYPFIGTVVSIRPSFYYRSNSEIEITFSLKENQPFQCGLAIINKENILYNYFLKLCSDNGLIGGLYICGYYKPSANENIIITNINDPEQTNALHLVLNYFKYKELGIRMVLDDIL